MMSPALTRQCECNLALVLAINVGDELPQARAEAAEAEASRLEDEIDDLERRLSAADATAASAQTELDAVMDAEQAARAEMAKAQAEAAGLRRELATAADAAADGASQV